MRIVDMDDRQLRHALSNAVNLNKPMKVRLITDEVKARIAGRKVIADKAVADQEIIFAREVVAGAWDHRGDVSRAINAARTLPA